eukprot:INCI13955.2.p1 GENE.INCI13955.2~~INCI13955.2.p1  ORF type:complete len:287 (-),score=34.11 INCI13955.2:53-913(-)
MHPHDVLLEVVHRKETDLELKTDVRSALAMLDPKPEDENKDLSRSIKLPDSIIHGTARSSDDDLIVPKSQTRRNDHVVRNRGNAVQRTKVGPPSRNVLSKNRGEKSLFEQAGGGAETELEHEEQHVHINQTLQAQSPSASPHAHLVSSRSLPQLMSPPQRVRGSRKKAKRRHRKSRLDLAASSFADPVMSSDRINHVSGFEPASSPASSLSSRSLSARGPSISHASLRAKLRSFEDHIEDGDRTHAATTRHSPGVQVTRVRLGAPKGRRTRRQRSSDAMQKSSGAL